MSLNGTQNRVGANVLRRHLGWPGDMLKEYDEFSHDFPGHEQRMRNHCNRIYHGERKENKRLAVIRKAQKRLAVQRRTKRLSETRKEKRRLANLAKENAL